MTGYIVELERPLPNWEDFEGRALAQNEGQLSAWCEEAGIPPLLGFLYVPPEEILAVLASVGFKGSAVLPEPWHDPTAGLAMARFLVPRLQREPEALYQVDQLEAELVRLQRLLSDASEQNIRWRLRVEI